MVASNSSSLILQLVFVIGLLQSPFLCEAWVSQKACAPQSSVGPKSRTRTLETVAPSQDRFGIVLGSSVSSTESLALSSDDDDDEYEYVEYDILTESEFMGSEWLVGTVMDNRDQIGETWVRLATDKDGKNVAIWGDNSEGNWNFDVANQFLSVSKNSVIGKNIWAGVVDDYYFCRGTVRGWNFFSPASVVGQWQARRLGVDKEEAGTAPWFEEDEGEEETQLDTTGYDSV